MAESRSFFSVAQHAERRLRYLLPALALLTAVVLWELIVRIGDIPPYVLPGPALVIQTLVADWGVLSASLWVTLKTTALALFFATLGGVLLAVLFSTSRVVELSLFPFAVILQVTPIIAIAPLLLVYLEPNTAVLVCAWIVAFFPILSNTALGLASVDHNLRDLFALYGASRTKTLLLLRIPSALPYFLGGLRIAGGLALIGAVVAEIAAGTAGRGSGLAYRIVESGYRLNVPRMFAALLLISVAGIAIFAALSLVQYLALRRWHESAVERGG
jgi:NitT/TauT family transport system permease protein